jgi:hypothetical protein
MVYRPITVPRFPARTKTKESTLYAGWRRLNHCHVRPDASGMHEETSEFRFDDGIGRCRPRDVLTVFEIDEGNLRLGAGLGPPSKPGLVGFVHAGMRPIIWFRTLEVALEGEIVAPRKPLEYWVAESTKREIADLDISSPTSKRSEARGRGIQQCPDGQAPLPARVHFKAARALHLQAYSRSVTGPSNQAIPPRRRAFEAATTA